MDVSIVFNSFKDEVKYEILYSVNRLQTSLGLKEYNENQLEILSFEEGNAIVEGNVDGIKSEFSIAIFSPDVMDAYLISKLNYHR